MKKTYIQPAVKTSASYSESPLLAGTVTGDNGSGWGGVDENGEKDPDANDYNIWDENYEYLPASTSSDTPTEQPRGYW